MVSRWAKIATILAVVGGTYLLGRPSDQPRPAATALTAEGSQAEPSPEAKAALVKQTEAKAKEDAEWRMMVLKARLLKQSMKNPESFKLESLLKMADGSLCFSYRATNSFNAIVPGYAVAAGEKLLADGNAGFDQLWAKRCAGKHGDDFTHARRAI